MAGQRVITNYMEDMVDECLDNLLRTAPPSGCTCPICVATIKMEALNSLPTFYVTSKVGEVYGEYRLKEQQYSADIAIAVSRAVAIVAARGHRGT